MEIIENYTPLMSNSRQFGHEFMKTFLETHFEGLTDFSDRDVLVGQLTRLCCRISMSEEYALEYDGEGFEEKVEEAREDLVEFCTRHKKKLCKHLPQIRKVIADVAKEGHQMNQRKLVNKLYVVLKLAQTV